VDFAFSPDDEQFRAEVRDWLADHLVGEFQALGASSKIGDGPELEVFKEWERELASGGWIGMAWPREYGGREVPLIQELVFHEEYSRAGGPQRAMFFAEELLGPTLMAFGTDEQKQRFLPKILRAEEFWCQGFSEPDAGSDLANVKTAAVLDGDEWVINGQKIWTSLGHIADWIFVVCRTDPDAPKKHQGISYLLCPLDQPGIDMRPIRQMTGSAEFNEVFFTDARTAADLVVGDVDDGWKVVMGTLGFERGAAYLGQQLRWQEEFDALVEYARRIGRSEDPVLRQRIAKVLSDLKIVRLNGLRTITQILNGGNPGAEASISKLHWSEWRRQFGQLEMDVVGADSMLWHERGLLEDFQHTFLFSRAETIYAGSNEIQRNIIGERVLGLPR
jgi:alkylation response protein AidB-like acyl-CoA dehydrogenase